MKLNKHLYINGASVPLVRDHIFLELSTPGRADFTVQSTAKLSGIVHLEIGLAGRQMVDFFTGYIQKSTTVDGKQQRIFCRELTGVLLNKYPVSARRVSFNDVLGIYARKTGLHFVPLSSDYATEQKPVYQSAGTGLAGLDSLGSVFCIPDYIWQQQADGTVFAGSFKDSKWYNKEVTVSEAMFQDVGTDGSKTIQATPGLRPGVKINGDYITSLQLQGHKMMLSCDDVLSMV